MICQCRFISCNTCSILVQDIGNRAGSGREREIYGKFCTLYSIFFCKPKTDLKYKVYLKKSFRSNLVFLCQRRYVNRKYYLVIAFYPVLNSQEIFIFPLDLMAYSDLFISNAWYSCWTEEYFCSPVPLSCSKKGFSNGEKMWIENSYYIPNIQVFNYFKHFKRIIYTWIAEIL